MIPFHFLIFFLYKLIYSLLFSVCFSLPLSCLCVWHVLYKTRTTILAVLCQQSIQRKVPTSKKCVLLSTLLHQSTANGDRLHKNPYKPYRSFGKTHTQLCSHTMQHHPPTAICNTLQQNREKEQDKDRENPAQELHMSHYIQIFVQNKNTTNPD